MSRKSRIGRYTGKLTFDSTTEAARPLDLEVQEPLVKTAPGVPIKTVNYRGKAQSLSAEFDFSDFDDCILIVQHYEELFREFIAGRSPATVTVIKGKLRQVATFIQWVEELEGLEITTPEYLGRGLNSLMFLFLSDMSDTAQYNIMNFFRRFLRALGVSEGEIPQNPYPSYSAASSETNSEEFTLKFFNHFKHEAEIIRARLKERDDYRGQGIDPRRSHGGPSGSWTVPENRMYVLERVLGTRIRPVVDQRENGLRSAVAGLEANAGAMTLRSDGDHKRKKGVTGHLAWLYPSQRDLFPFVVLLLMRTNFPISTTIGLRFGEYLFRPLTVTLGTRSRRIMQFAALKFRTKSRADSEPEYIHCLTVTTVWSHAYQLVKTVEDVTKPLRDELYRQISELSRTRLRTKSEAEELARLKRIKNDLFLYTANAKISSLAEHSDAGVVPSFFGRCLMTLGFPTDLRRLRNTKLANAFTHSGGKDYVISFLADHRSPDSVWHYRNRDALHRKRVGHPTYL